MNDTKTEWFDDYAPEEEEDYQIDEYELTATPNDFNVITIYSFIESGAVRIPGFQRNYVWDLRRASKLIESLILGLPVPQIFLYEEGRNKFLVIDGQQRLMSLYYFLKQRFPKKERRVELRRIFDERGSIPDEILHDDKYFTPFKLSLPEKLPNQPNKFKGLNYSTLGDLKVQLDLRPIRNVIIKQNHPKGDDSSIFEIFNRLNTGGINLRPQEIRSSLYHSPFFDMLNRLNVNGDWRRLLRMPEPDLHTKDVEILLRAYAMLIDSSQYAPSMIKFLNQFSRKCKAYTPEQNAYLEKLFIEFLSATRQLPDDSFISKRTKRFNIALFEAAFATVCRPAFESSGLPTGALLETQIRSLDSDKAFQAASLEGTTQRANVDMRLERARKLITPLKYLSSGDGQRNS